MTAKKATDKQKITMVSIRMDEATLAAFKAYTDLFDLPQSQALKNMLESHLRPIYDNYLEDDNLFKQVEKDGNKPRMGQICEFLNKSANEKALHGGGK